MTVLVMYRCKVDINNSVRLELHLVRVRVSPTLVGPEPLRFGCGLTAKTRY